MNYYVGLDVAMEETAICIVDDEGRIVRECTGPLPDSNLRRPHAPTSDRRVAPARPSSAEPAPAWSP
jgi:hypothetical protein